MTTDCKDMMSFEECILTMNPKEYADVPVNQYGMTDFSIDGRSPWLVRYKVSNEKFGVLAGKNLNPLIFRGENKEYEYFLPSAKRGPYTKSDHIKKEKFLSVYKETPYYKYGMSYTDNFGYHMEIDLEAVAQHYGFKTNYLDVTRSRDVAEFFAYTYYDKGEYHPITDFTKYTPCIYTADLHDIYRQRPNSLKLISGQIALRPCTQFAMAVDVEDDFDCKLLFQKEMLPKDPVKAKNIYDSLHNYLFSEQDVLNKIANAILMEDESMNIKIAKDFDDKIEEEIQNFFKPLLEKIGYRGCAKVR